MSNIKVYSIDQLKDIFTEVKDRVNSLQMIEVPEVKPFNECTWDEIISFVNGYYQGIYSLSAIQEVWNIGDSKSITTTGTTSAIDYFIAAQPVQTIEFTIIGFNHDPLVTKITDKDNALLTLASKTCLSGAGDLAKFSEGATGGYYDKCDIISWLDDTFLSAFPTNIKNAIKQVSRAYNKLSNQKTSINEKLFLLNRKEITGTGSVGTQYPYYANSDNQKKAGKDRYWLAEYSRTSSPYPYYYYFSNSDKSVSDYYAGRGSSYGIAPAFCL